MLTVELTPADLVTLKPLPTEFPPLVPWMIRSMLVARGVPVDQITVERFRRLKLEEIDRLELSLLDGMTMDETRAEVRKWTKGLRDGKLKLAA